MKAILLLSVCILLCARQSSGQVGTPDAATNTIYAELGGHGMFVSLNYERTVSGPVLLRIGLSEWSACGWTGECNHTTAVPIGASYLIGGLPELLGGGRGRWIELGAGLIPGWKGSGRGEVENRNLFVSVGGSAGLRRQPPEGGVMFRAALTPVLTLGTDDGFPSRGFMLFGGISLGYAF